MFPAVGTDKHFQFSRFLSWDLCVIGINLAVHFDEQQKNCGSYTMLLAFQMDFRLSTKIGSEILVVAINLRIKYVCCSFFTCIRYDPRKIMLSLRIIVHGKDVVIYIFKKSTIVFTK